MPTPLDAQCSVILYAAIAAELGLVVRTNDPIKARAAIYTARRNLGDPTLAPLQIRVSPNDVEHEIWIIRRSAITPTVSHLDLI